MEKMGEIALHIPSVMEFRQLTEERQEEAYRRAYRPLHLKRVKFPIKRARLLQAYQEAIGWPIEKVRLLRQDVCDESVSE